MYFVEEGSVVLHMPFPAACVEPLSQPQHPPHVAGQCDGDGVDSAAKAAGKGERIAGKGDVFGEGGLFPEELGPHRQESGTTLSRVSALVLSHSSLLEIADEYPEVGALARKIVACLRADKSCTA